MRCASIERFWKPAWRIPRSHSTNAVSCTAPPCGRWKPSRCAAAGFSTTAAAPGLLPSARDPEKRGYTAGHFSFNIPGGRCETCQGDGTVTVEMQFLADVELVCEECKGTRFKTGVLEIRYNGLNIHEVLQLTVHEAIEFFR